MLSRLLGPLLLLVPPLPLVHDARHGRVGLGGDLDEVEPLAVGVLAGFVGRLDPELRAVLVDQPDARDANVLVDPLLLPNGPDRWLEPPTRPQRLVTKLRFPPFLNVKSRCKQRPVTLVVLRLG